MANMNMSPIAEQIDLLSREKGIDPQMIIDAITEAVLRAYQKQYRNVGEDVDVRYNPDTGLIEIFARMTVVEDVTDPDKEISLDEANQLVEGAEAGDILEIQRPFEGMGRIAAQVAKQVITQKVREAERNNVYEEYIQQKDALVSGFVKRFEKRGDIIIDLGSVEALLPRSEQSKVEKFSLNERIRAVIVRVTKDVKETYGQQIILSRTCPELLSRLFEMEVPEIYDGTVQIKAAVREPGDRAKIAVASTDRDVDPVGACVGMKGSRVQAVIRELHGEKIDIIEWAENPAVFAANALSPAKVNKVQILDPENRRLEVIVEDDQQSLAIGKQGQNVRLAARLVGWNIDIRSESEVKRTVVTQMAQLITGATPVATAQQQLGQETVALLTSKNIQTLEQLIAAGVDGIAERLDCSLAQASEIVGLAQQALASEHPAAAHPSTDEAGPPAAASQPATDEASPPAAGHAVGATTDSTVNLKSVPQASALGKPVADASGTENVRSEDSTAERQPEKELGASLDS
jgi:N utilization substance protein A